MRFARVADASVYTSRALAAAREAYAPYLTVTAKPEDHGSVRVTLMLKPGCEGDARQIVLEFWNYYLDAACQRKLEAVPE